MKDAKQIIAGTVDRAFRYSESKIVVMGDVADAILAALQAAGQQIVPVEPTDEMLVAMLSWRETDSNEGSTPEVDMFQRAWHRALSVSSLAASRKRKGDENG